MYVTFICMDSAPSQNSAPAHLRPISSQVQKEMKNGLETKIESCNKSDVTVMSCRVCGMKRNVARIQ